MNEILLNNAQKRAVDTIYGPLLVLAGPGTGKTQLLSSRVAAILQNTDVTASNILCLTFTESGARNMRERLVSLIGDAAYDVTISTYHSFGSDIIKNYAEYFQTIGLDRTDDVRLETPVDELTQIQIVENIVSSLSFDSPLLSARYFVKNVVSTISDLKQHLISPDELRKIAKSNLDQIDSAQKLLNDAVNSKGGISRKKAEYLEQYAQLEAGMSELAGDLIAQAHRELKTAYDEATEANSSKPLTAWKNTWLIKDDHDNFTLTERLRSEKMLELANVYQAYEQELRKRAAYDFDDMILRAIDGLKNTDELRYNLQERYQFILLDEFQDTNPSQFELVKRIADHPVHEGRPNIMAVGDDDQAIFAFQGAHVGNMKDFVESFKDVSVINLTDNYRSHADVLHVAHNISKQIEDRLHTKFDDIDKILAAQNKELPPDANIERHEFAASASEYSWVAKKIHELVSDKKNPTKPSQIAVLAPKHRILEGCVPFLKNLDIPLAYEKRENILETEIISGLHVAAKLLHALATNNTAAINQHLPIVLSLPYWQVEAREIWQVNWHYSGHSEKRSWAEIALENKKLAPAVEFYLALANESANEPLESTLDKLIGTATVSVNGHKQHAPLKEYYFNQQKRASDALKYYEAVSHLSVIRAKLRNYQANSDRKLTLTDFLDFFVMYESADEALINSHPIALAENAVQLMTAYKAKGLEYEHVFILNAHNDVWGSASFGGNNKVSLPPNLSHIRYVGSSDDERKRLFYVAITRAKHGLYITSHKAKDDGKATVPLQYLAETDGTSTHLPEKSQSIITNPLKPQELAEDIETLWLAGQVSLPADFKSLLADRLKRYQMSPTHLNSFINLKYAGPESFLVNTLLKFPQAPGASGEFGTAIHDALEWYQNETNRGKTLNVAELLERYDRELAKRYLSDADYVHAQEKGHDALQKFMAKRSSIFEIPAKAEVNFYSEGVVLGDVRLSGKIDRLEVDEENKTVTIVDYKTGKTLRKWGNDLKSITYKQQLYMYKLLIENSTTWKSYTVKSARLEFVEPHQGSIIDPLYLDFDEQEEKDIRKLIAVVWEKIQKLDLPDVSNYKADDAGSKKFISELLN